MKKLLCLLAVTALLTGCSNHEQNEEDVTDWQTAYSGILLDFSNSGDYPRAAFSVHDVNSDGVPELFISQGVARAERCFVYTFSDEVVQLGEHGEYGYVGFDTVLDQLVATDAVQGYSWRGYYELRGGNHLEFVQDFYDNYGAAAGTNAVEFHINGEAVTEEEYRTAVAEYSGHEVLWLGRDNELTAETAAAVTMEGI